MEGHSAPEVWKEGFSYKGPPTDYLGRIVKHELPVGAAESLSALCEEYSFFTPAILYLLGTVTDQPLSDLMYELQQDIPIYYKKFNRRIFNRLDSRSGDPDWNYALWAVHREHWDYFLDFYCSIAVFDRVSQHVQKVAVQTFKISDPLVKTSVFLGNEKSFDITAFGVNGSKFIAAFSFDNSSQLPSLKFFQPDPGTQVFARAIARGDNPHIAEETYRLQQQRETGRGQER